jgi:hypothetical protein
MLAAPAVEPTIPRRVIVWTLVTVLILIVGFGVLLAGLSHFEKQAARKQQKAAAAPHPETNAPTEAVPHGKRR